MTKVLDAATVAGTAHVTIQIATTGGSLNVVQRATGAVNFAAGSYRLSYASSSSAPEPGQPYVEIDVRNRTHLEPSVPGVPGGPTVSSLPSFELPRQQGAVSQIVALLPRPAGVWQVHVLGPITLAGRATTHYQLTVVVHPICMAHVAETLQVWIDARGRIVRATTTSRVNVSASGAAGAGETTIETLTLSAFGAPVVVTPPSPGAVEGPSGTGTARLDLHCSS